MKKIIFFLILIVIAFLLKNHFDFIAKENTEIDLLQKGISQFEEYIDEESTLSFMANSPEEIKLHFESQFVVAPTLLEKGFHPHKFLVYIENINSEPNEYLPLEQVDLVKSVIVDRFRFTLFKRKLL